MTDHLLTLHQAEDRNRVGGKAHVLARLAAAGLPVPDSIVIPADLPAADLPAAADQVLAWAAGRAPYGLIARSSAANEDGATDSYAGLYASRFTPAEHGHLLDAIRQVRSSASSTAVASYARLRRAGHDVRLAVLIQPALRPHASGVLAAHLTAEGLGRWRIEAVRGLAEPLVSGRQVGEIHTGTATNAAPAHLTDQPLLAVPPRPGELDLPPGEWIALNQPDRTILPAKISTSGDGMVLLHTPRPFGGIQLFRPQWRDALLGLVPAVARALAGRAVDIEWCIDENGPLILVQARPLTTELPSDSTATPDWGWTGIPASPGCGAGPAIHLDGGTKVQGSVLICEALGPEAVDVLLHQPAAVVATTGGPLSHTAIIARELAIPCVTNVTGALTLIPAGRMVEVNGTSGTVRPVAGIPSPAKPTTGLAYGTAVLTRQVPDGPCPDGRWATIVWIPNDNPLPPLPGIAARSGILGVLISPSGHSLATVPQGYELLQLPDLNAHLLWPQKTPLPRSMAVLGPSGQVIYAREITILRREVRRCCRHRVTE